MSVQTNRIAHMTEILMRLDVYRDALDKLLASGDPGVSIVLNEIDAAFYKVLGMDNWINNLSTHVTGKPLEEY